MPNSKLLFLISLLVVFFIPTRSDACTSCPTIIELSTPDAECLLSKLPQLVAEAEFASPVIAFLNCDREVPAENDDRTSIGYPLPKLPYPSANDPQRTDNTASRAKYLILSKIQLTCLDKVLKNKLENAVNRLFFDFNTCD